MRVHRAEVLRESTFILQDTHAARNGAVRHIGEGSCQRRGMQCEDLLEAIASRSLAYIRKMSD